MGLNDDREKIRQAEEWLLTEPADSEFYIAAQDRLLSLIEWSDSESLRDEAKAAYKRAMRNDIARAA